MKGTSVLLFVLTATFAWPRAAGQQTAGALQKDKSVVVEGSIASVDVDGRSLVLRAKIEREDTFDIGSAVIIKPETPHPAIADLVRNSLVEVRYTMSKGIKVASHIIMQPFKRETPPSIIQEENVIVAEGSITSINDKGGTMVIRAALDRLDTFAVDSAAVIRADGRVSTLDEVKDYLSVNVRYMMKEGRKVIGKIIGTGSKSGGVR
jgi:hypothetical protein